MAPRQRQASKKQLQRGGASKLFRPQNGSGAHHTPESHLKEPLAPQSPFSGVQICVYGAVFSLALLCYANTLSHDLVHDDIFAIEGNRDVRGESPLRNLLLDDFWGKPMWDNTSHKSYRPLCVITFRLNHMLHGLHPMGYHLVNILLHAVVSVLFTYVCQTVVFTEMMPTAVAGVLFATHPIHTEAVAGVVGRADLMACLFFLLSFLAFQRSIKQGKSGFAFTDRPGSLVLSLLLVVCALLSKEHGATVLGVFMVYDVMMTSRPGIYRVLITRRFGRGCMPLFKRCAVIVATVCVVLFLRVWMLQGHLPHFSEQDNPASFAPHLLTRFLTYSYLVFFNVWLLLCPLTLSYDWQMNSIPLVESLWDVRNLATITTVITLGFLAVSCIVVKKDQDRRVLVLGLSFLAIPFLPASNLFIRVGFVVAERILYIPSMGYCILCAHALSKLGGLSSKHGKTIMMIIVAVITLLYIGKTVTRNQVWKSRESLFRSGLETLPHNAKMHYNYANFLMDSGQKQDAIHHYQTSLRLWPDHASANNNLGTLLKDDPQQAEAHYRRAILINPAHVRAHFNLGSHLSKLGQFEDAELLFRRAIQLNPEFADVHTNLASLLEGKGQLLEAEQLYLNAITLEPKNGDYCNNYGAFLTNTGRNEDARIQYEECLHLQPNHTVTMGNQARLLRRLGQTSQAEQLFLRALSLERRAGLLESLGALYFNTDRPEKAHDAYREAVQLNPQSAETRTHYGQVLATLGKVEQAVKELQVALELDADYPEAHRQLASIYVLAGKHREGLKHATVALQLDPDADDARKAGLLFDIGNCLKELARDQQAIQSYREAVKLNPNLSSAHLNLGAMLHLKGDYAQARRHYNEALKLDPENHTLKQNIAKLNRAVERLKKKGKSQLEIN
ncbi:protein O-mannosyl-transferase TMTC1-like [Patiria miniata]|uniref:dolichyl-phosphate-mannose--protein mannosyltransferase n=1 Tax=Patiria miniata TaxID=46514 RepID=A0A914B8E0_PATMI|nr:protein O-mannosyl-transferase TMTC1-like [Patiria miniata]